MRFYTFLFFFIFMPVVMSSQTYEIGGFLGAANYIGDVGKTTFIAPKTSVFGGIFKWNRSPRHSFRGTILFGKIEGDDNQSKDPRRKERGYKFENSLNEVTVGLEYTFWEFSMYSGQAAQTPYLFTGISYLGYNSLIKNNNDLIIKDGNASTLAIPMVVGYKTTLGQNFVLAAEIGARYTFTDNLDGSNPKKASENQDDVSFGNINNNDWYVFTGITLTFTFGRKPCYCNF
ncbi:MAG: hypothetical protein EVA43_01410 [Flavobacteriales bacterium]|nr:MAG: hypothetical protein EVA43_01410 [Flavobacteriales bacterium]